jgi:hypothetical protein
MLARALPLISALVSVVLLTPADAATLAHRYSFSGDTVDSVGGNDGVLLNGATVTGTALDLPGTGTALNAASMGFSSTVGVGENFGASGVSIEAWYTDEGTGTWGKLFQFGTNQLGLELAWTHYRAGGDLAPGIDRNGAHGVATYPFGSNTRLPLNEEHHIAITVASDGTTNLWLNGNQEITNLATNPLSNVTSVTERIGATSWGDPGHLGEVNEFRIWEEPLTADEVSQSFALGPDTVIPEPAMLALLGATGVLLILRRRRR